MKKLFFISIMLVFVAGMNGCVSEVHDSSEDTTLENYNRAVFGFNNKLDTYVFRPIAKGYNKVTNEYVRSRISDFFNNINEPVSAANHLLQGEFSKTGNNLGRFVINTTLGGVGLYDVASKVGLERTPTGFDETMAAWCVPDGPFVMLPVFGPSTPRAAIGFVADGYSSPMYIVANESHGEDAMTVYYGLAGLKYLNLYAENVKWLESLEEGSVDYYETIKSTYLQNRGKIKTCGRTAEQEPEYDFDMDVEDYED